MPQLAEDGQGVGAIAAEAARLDEGAHLRVLLGIGSHFTDDIQDPAANTQDGFSRVAQDSHTRRIVGLDPDGHVRLEE
jgi:hypothetical protein